MSVDLVVDPRFQRRGEMFHLRPREIASPADISRLDLGDVARFRPLYGYERVNSCSSYELIFERMWNRGIRTCCKLKFENCFAVGLRRIYGNGGIN